MISSPRGAGMHPLTVPGRLDSLAAIRAFVTEAAQQATLDERATYNLSLAVDETATNIVLHGYQEQGLSGDIGVGAEIGDDALVVVLEDTGAAFDPATRSMPTEQELAKPLEQRAIGGLGVFLALSCVDSFHYERRGDVNRNIFRMKRSRLD